MASAHVPSGAERYSVLSRRDKLILGIMVGIPTFLVVFFILLPTILSIVLSFTSWNGIGAHRPDQVHRLQELPDPVHQVPAVLAGRDRTTSSGWPASCSSPRRSACSWRSCWTRTSAARRIYQSALYLPVVLSLAIIGFIWQLQYSPDQGFINSVLGTNQQGNIIDWLGDKRHQPVGGARRGELAPGRLRDDPLPGRPQGVRPQPARGRPDRRRQRAADVLPGRLPGAASPSTS